jgi:hypothetical protein
MPVPKLSTRVIGRGAGAGGDRGDGAEALREARASYPPRRIRPLANWLRVIGQWLVSRSRKAPAGAGTDSSKV